MIGCIIVGGLAALGVASIARRRLHGGWGCGGPCTGAGGIDGGRGGNLEEDESDWIDGGRGPHGHHHHGPVQFGGWAGGHNPLLHGQGRRFILRSVLRRLETTPTQERALRDAAKEFRDSAQVSEG